MWFRQSTVAAFFTVDVHHMEWYGKILVVLWATILHLQTTVAILGATTSM